MKQDLKSYLSWVNYSNDAWGTRAKLATLWFDEVVLQVPDEYAIYADTEIWLANNCSTSTLNQIRKIWVPIFKYFPEYNFIRYREPGYMEKITKENPIIYRVMNLTRRMKIAETRQRYPNSSTSMSDFNGLTPGDMGIVDSVNLWLAINHTSPCTFVPDNQEHYILQRLFSNTNKSTEIDVLKEIFSGSVPSLTDVSWDKIIELRHHNFFNSFRSKVQEIQDKIASGDLRTVREIIDEMRRKDIQEMIDLFRPAPVFTTIKAIASEMPLPLPFNPFSLLMSISEVRKEIDRSRKYGWLYFLFDVRK